MEYRIAILYVRLSRIHYRPPHGDQSVGKFRILRYISRRVDQSASNQKEGGAVHHQRAAGTLQKFRPRRHERTLLFGVLQESARQIGSL